MKRREMLKTGIAAGSALAMPAILKAQTQYKPEYKMSTVVGPALAWGKGGEIFANLARENTHGRINIKMYPGASLVQGQQDREFAAMRQGIIDVLCGAPINWSTTVKECLLYALPFLLPDHRAYDAVVNHEVTTKDFFDIIRRNGAEPLAVGETGYRQLSNSKRPVVKPDDLKGLKIRVVASPMFQEIMTGLGANPTSMSWADAQPALASGAVDGQENPMEVFLGFKIHTLGQKYVTKWNYTNDILLFAIANPVWSSWTPQDQKLVREAAQEAARQQTKLVRDIYARDVDAVRAIGVEVHVPTPAEMEQWQIAARRPYARWKAHVGAPLVTKVEEVVAKTRKA
ncbi:MAG TPA: TRAP transporter substrate-binding protein DctP [Burkholderiaceae bacterium]|nr:TRAP transporter substrate-binding protein DctP [Burkholderiaceae bacterium]